jgi:putative hydrolase of the HAD superfamily
MVIFFDIDDTLVDHSHAMRSAALALHSSLELSLAAEAFLLNWSAALARYYPRYLNGEVTYEAARRARIRETVDSQLDDEKADSLFEEYLANYESGWALFPDVLPCLDRLASHRLGLISNARTAEQRKKLRKLGLDNRFEHLLTAEECGCAKPDRQIFERACQQLGARPVDAVHVGDDYEIDACGARNAGLRGIWLNRNGTLLGHGATFVGLSEKYLKFSNSSMGSWLPKRPFIH